jgi:chromosome segregation ATPase
LESADQTVKTEPEAIAPETAIEISESLADDPQIESDVTVASESLSDDPRSDAMNNLIKELEEKNRALTETLEKKQAELDIALNTNEQMTEQQSKLQWSAMNSEAQMRLLNITLEQVRKEKDALDTSIKNKKHPQYDSSETEASSARIKELEAQISRDQIELNRLEDKLALAEEEVTNLQRRLTQLTDQKATCQVLEKRIAELKKKLSDSEKRSELLLKQLRKTARERQDLELQLKGFSE